MRKDDIEVGGEYLVSRGRGNGRALVKGPPERSPGLYSWSKPVYKMPVEFPDSLQDGKPIEAKVPTKSFVHPWTDEDDDRFQKGMEEEERRSKIEDRLVKAGFKPTYVRFLRHGDERELWLDFEGEVAERLVEHLTGGK